MLHIAVFGNSKWSFLMKDILEKEYSDLFIQNGGEGISVDTLVVLGNPQNEGEISIQEFGQKYALGELIGIVIPKEYYIPHNNLVLTLLRARIDINDIYEGIRLSDQVRTTPELLASLITPTLSDPYLSYLEYHVADHCNLNCKYCTHYSPLVNEPVFADFERFSSDLKQLKKRIPDIGIIRILGGEPLLNPELSRFIEFTRELYPASIITVVTNGLLVRKMSADLIRIMKENMAFIHISFYPPLQEQITQIKSFLYEQQIPFTITGLTTEFNKTQTLVPNVDEEFFYSCFQASCTCLQDGKLAPCYAPFTTKYFNEAFSKEIPMDEGIDIYDESLPLEDLKIRLLLPMERCRYCVSGSASPWEVVGKHSILEDWVID
ncbi:MAG: radical SAM protein [Lachnospiraceae bacterium]|nr:radical SAM protein [Lachnospiraceae bacterium]